MGGQGSGRKPSEKTLELMKELAEQNFRDKKFMLEALAVMQEYFYQELPVDDDYSIGFLEDMIWNINREVNNDEMSVLDVLRRMVREPGRWTYVVPELRGRTGRSGSGRCINRDVRLLEAR